MKFSVTNPKIKASHLSRRAVIYIRRSSVYQAEEHTASGKYQRSFSELARAYGWGDGLIIEVDEDDGRSGTDTTKRKGFQWLRQQIFEGKVGAIFCWEASRLARDNAGFAQLVKLCGACDTLIIDEKGAYDPNNINDSMYLGFMGVINHNESLRTGERSKAAKRMKAEAGELRLIPATGYVYDGEGKLVFDPDMRVQNTFRLFFSKFEEYGSATKVIKHFNRNGIKFPAIKRNRGRKSTIEWVELYTNRVLYILHNPVYAGTYAFGLSKITREMLSADATEQEKKRVKLNLDSDEPVLIHGSHEGYITWERFIRNQKILEDNRFLYPAGKGAIRDGSALLQGIVVCGSCLYKLVIHYKAKSNEATYVCDSKIKHFGKYACLAISAGRLDGIVTDELMRVVSPAQLQLTLQELEEVDKESQTDECHVQEELITARAECDEARLRFEAIDPRSTLVFKEYEKKLLEKMREVRRLENKCAKTFRKPSRRDLTSAALESLLALPQDLRAFWESATVTNAERKQLLRCLIHQVIVRRRESSEYQDIIIHWVGGAVTWLTALKHGGALRPEAIELMRRLAPDHTVTQIIDRLHEAGFKPRPGFERFTASSVRQTFKAHGINLACPEQPRNDKPRGDGRFSLSAVATMLNVDKSTVRRWCANGILDAIRNSSKGYYWIKISPEQISALKKPRPAGGLNASVEQELISSKSLPKSEDSPLQR